ncbi:MAG: alginate export family protein [Planctomycetes bacterium]|nr:alginate export family protein [Planctomycetota bacterium]
MRAWMAAAAATAAALLPAGGAAAGEEELRRELEETKEQVRRLLDRVETLEGRAGSPGELGEAVEKYLREHPPAAPAMPAGAPGAGNVSAPGSKALRFSGHILFWWEQWNGSYRALDPAGEDVNDVGWLRASLQADATITDDLRARVEIRDARAWGQEPSTTGQLQAPSTGTDLKQGWFEADDLFGCGTSTRAGRQVLSYGDQRVVGELDWHTYGRSFDGALFSRTFGGTKADLFAARVVERGAGAYTPGVDNDDRDLLGLYTMTPGAVHHSDLDAYVLFLKDRLAMAGEAPGTSGNTSLLTGGFRLVGAKDGFDWGTEWALQDGSVAGDAILAWAGHARFGYTMTETKGTPRIGVEWDMATGDDDPSDGDRGSFQTLFPTNHMHYGILDLMAWQNMQGFRASFSVAPAEKWTLQVDWWRLYLEDADDAWYGASGAVIRPGAAGASKYLGSELDLVLTWKASDRMKVALGGAQFFDGGFVRDTGGGGDTFWFYVRVQVGF